ncbi:hypothetical protein GF359_02065 [candidate division WOR-3 bacterium]|uniref:Uncharacterized protein n=1 Tax=candidate division WOR-3 bacterium TaxID=2052148 RepID=A0A9D5K9D0_UNCW3|nr:hypothetical protein [candidate division WOR-3 bacterium]MBD3363979.1 hypothetical protein [candidate division WOR-3 bacterium]
MAKEKLKDKAKTVPDKTSAIPREIEWNVFLAPERPWRTVIVLVLILGMILLIGKFVFDVVPGDDPSIRILPAILAGLLTFILFFATLNNYFVPIHYHLDRENIIIKKFYYTDRRPWSMFRRFFMTRSGIVLSTFATRRKFLDNTRGVQLLLPTDRQKREKVLDFIQSKVPLDPGQSRQ